MRATKTDQSALWAAALEFLVVIGASFGYLIWLGTSGATTNSFSKDGTLRLIAYEAVVLLSVGALLRYRRWKPSELGLRPRWTDLLWGLYLVAAAFLAYVVLAHAVFNLGSVLQP